MPSKTYFCYDNDNVMVRTINSDTSRENLNPGVYAIQHDQVRGFYLRRTSDNFKVPSLVFGNVEDKAAHIIKRYDSQDKSVGVLLTGDKGSGKSLLTTLVANEMISRGLSVLTVSQPYHGDEFNTFIESIGECVLLFDEFAKVYGAARYHSDSEQSKLLSLFDGIVSGKRLSLVTENDVGTLNEFLLNRPGRFMYHYRYTKLDEDVIAEYCNHYGVGHIAKEISDIRNASTTFSMDILTAIVSEYKMFGNKDTVVRDMCGVLNIDSNAIKNRYILTVESITKNGITYKPTNTIKFHVNSLTDFGECCNINYNDENQTFSSPNFKPTNRGGHELLEPTLQCDESDESDEEIYINSSYIQYGVGDGIVIDCEGTIIVLRVTDAEHEVWSKYLKAL